MGSTQSTHTTSEAKDLFSINLEEVTSSVSGQKNIEPKAVLSEEQNLVSNQVEDENSSNISSNDDSYAEDSDEEYESDDEEDEEWNERLRILEDARNLRTVAEFFLKPELPVAVDATACARCFFGRPSAPEQTLVEEEEEATIILAEAKALKANAVQYLHPELALETDSACFGRNFFLRGSAPEQESQEEAEERACILNETKQLKKIAADYLHPEKPVVTSDPFATGRNYFTRPSAEEFETDMDAKDQILEDMKHLKKLAVDYLHPEKPVKSTDPFATGRNYFSRSSAEEYEDEDAVDDRDEILADMLELKQLAMVYLHPEQPVQVDSLATCRNYFDRASAIEQESQEETEECDRVLADAAALKKLAVDYLHPEKPVVTSDPFATGRNFFTRPSAEVVEEDADERERILAEMKELKKLAIDYLHPEMPVKTTDHFATGRNFFTRPSAEVEEDADEREQILSEMKQLKQLAVDYLHPEKPVVTMDACATGRNFFSRPSAEEYEDEDDMDDRNEILEDMHKLKQLAVDYLHPEQPVQIDSLATCRNYFNRAGAPEQESLDDAEELGRIMADAAALKKLAVDYLHPEKPVVTSDPFATGRNYFTRATGPEQGSQDEAEERAQVLADAQALKRLAIDYLHPELPVKTTDAFATGRNYFTRPSAEEDVGADDMAEHSLLMDDMKKLKKLADDYLHPEKPVVTEDPHVFGRNFYLRGSAPSQETFEHAEEAARVIEEAKRLKAVAKDYLHPEAPILSLGSPICVRNYFNRPSATGHKEQIHSYAADIPHADSDDEDNNIHISHGAYHYGNYDYHDHHDHSCGASDHFEMDEDMFTEFRHSMQQNYTENQPFKGEHPKEMDEEEGKLSRSPSSVMLFAGGEEAY